jgi:hypothetical protein
MALLETLQHISDTVVDVIGKHAWMGPHATLAKGHNLSGSTSDKYGYGARGEKDRKHETSHTGLG